MAKKSQKFYETEGFGEFRLYAKAIPGYDKPEAGTVWLKIVEERNFWSAAPETSVYNVSLDDLQDAIDAVRGN